MPPRWIPSPVVLPWVSSRSARRASRNGERDSVRRIRARSRRFCCQTRNFAVPPALPCGRLTRGGVPAEGLARISGRGADMHRAWARGEWERWVADLRAVPGPLLSSRDALPPQRSARSAHCPRRGRSDRGCRPRPHGCSCDPHGGSPFVRTGVRPDWVDADDHRDLALGRSQPCRTGGHVGHERRGPCRLGDVQDRRVARPASWRRGRGDRRRPDRWPGGAGLGCGGRAGARTSTRRRHLENASDRACSRRGVRAGCLRNCRRGSGLLRRARAGRGSCYQRGPTPTGTRMRPPARCTRPRNRAAWPDSRAPCLPICIATGPASTTCTTTSTSTSTLRGWCTSTPQRRPAPPLRSAPAKATEVMATAALTTTRTSTRQPHAGAEHRPTTGWALPATAAVALDSPRR